MDFKQEVLKFNDNLERRINGAKTMLIRKQRAYKEAVKRGDSDSEISVIETEVVRMNMAIYELECVKCEFATLLDIANES